MDSQFMRRSHIPGLAGESYHPAPSINGMCTATCTEVRDSNPSGVRESNRISQFLFRMATLLAILLSGLLANAQESLLVYNGITPSAGSEISSFEFTLNFDISDVISTYGEDEYGIGWVGFHNDKLPTKEKSISLYEGDETSGTLLGRTCTSNFTGNTSGFEPGTSVSFSFPGLIPAEGKVYTLVITNEFKVYTKEKGATSLANTTLSYFSSPYKCTFIGGKASSETLSLVSSSIQSGYNVETLSELTYTFNTPINIASSTSIQVKEGDNIVAESKNVFVSDDNLSITYQFDDVPLYMGHLYAINLPKGVVTSINNTNMTNESFDINVNGAFIMTCNLKSSTPSNGDCSIFNKIECVFEMPDNYIMFNNQVVTVNHDISIYEDEVDDSKLIGTLTGVVNSTNDGFIWTNTISLTPEKTYILYIPEGQIKAYSTVDKKYAKDCANGEVRIVVTTPSVEESGFPPIELGDPVIGKHDGGGRVLKNGDSIDYLDFIEIAPVDYFYKGKDGTSNFRLYYDTHKLTGYLYDITNGTSELIKEVSLSCVQRETTTFEYGVISVPLKSVFYEGH